ncbi:MAG: FTR1 family protein [Alphaproteobacteria bacterium]|nr:FTR1 family protein [Alphaproteobacteria bacterium]
MFSSAIIFFREVFEIVLIVGIILAATRNLPGRTRWIALGFAGGIAGSALLAFFTENISNFADGLGQEIFNAAILFTAAGFIAWTVIWMKRHARDLKGHFNRVGEAVAAGDIPSYSLSAVIALAIWREGSEMVLFSYGMLASGNLTPSTLGLSAIMGLCAGLITGLLFYYGLLKVSSRYFMQFTSWLLVLLVAGMMSQGVGMLVAAGYFETLSATVWNSSWLIADSTMIGQSLNVLIGYTSRPMIIQIIVYVGTLLALYSFMKLAETRSNSKYKNNNLADAA